MGTTLHVSYTTFDSKCNKTVGYQMTQQSIDTIVQGSCHDEVHIKKDSKEIELLAL